MRGQDVGFPSFDTVSPGGSLVTIQGVNLPCALAAHTNVLGQQAQALPPDRPNSESPLPTSLPLALGKSLRVSSSVNETCY